MALTVGVAPEPTVKVLSHILKPGFSTLTLWSPAASFSVEGVLPMKSVAIYTAAAVIAGDVCEIDSHLIARLMLRPLGILKYA